MFSPTISTNTAPLPTTQRLHALKDEHFRPVLYDTITPTLPPLRPHHDHFTIFFIDTLRSFLPWPGTQRHDSLILSAHNSWILMREASHRHAQTFSTKYHACKAVFSFLLLCKSAWSDLFSTVRSHNVFLQGPLLHDGSFVFFYTAFLMAFGPTIERRGKILGGVLGAKVELDLDT
jgi:hypothetical protein